jgi:class 3 adenylate cyclase
MRENVVLALAEETGLSGEGGVPGQLTVAIAFVDLSSFTPLAEAMGDLKAAEVLNRFSSLVRDAAGHWQGRVVKQIGDGFMLVFPEARSAVGCVLEIRARASEEPQFPAVRSGVHWGSVLYREGDYVGANVIIASRLSVEAGRHQVLLTEAARREAVGLDGMELVRLGRRRFKGLAEEIEVFEVRAAAEQREAKAVDPVCAMELASAEVAASLMIGGQQVAFCSEECLRRYVASPQRYSAASA